MSDKAFIDTNVFIYLYSEDETANPTLKTLKKLEAIFGQELVAI